MKSASMLPTCPLGMRQGCLVQPRTRNEVGSFFSAPGTERGRVSAVAFASHPFVLKLKNKGLQWYVIFQKVFATGFAKQ